MIWWLSLVRLFSHLFGPVLPRGVTEAKGEWAHLPVPTLLNLCRFSSSSTSNSSAASAQFRSSPSSISVILVVAVTGKKDSRYTSWGRWKCVCIWSPSLSLSLILILLYPSEPKAKQTKPRRKIQWIVVCVFCCALLCPWPMGHVLGVKSKQSNRRLLLAEQPLELCRLHLRRLPLR